MAAAALRPGPGPLGKYEIAKKHREVIAGIRKLAGGAGQGCSSRLKSGGEGDQLVIRGDVLTASVEDDIRGCRDSQNI